jgi:hypothetical protein
MAQIIANLNDIVNGYIMENTDVSKIVQADANIAEFNSTGYNQKVVDLHAYTQTKKDELDDHVTLVAIPSVQDYIQNSAEQYINDYIDNDASGVIDNYILTVSLIQVDNYVTNTSLQLLDEHSLSKIGEINDNVVVKLGEYNSNHETKISEVNAVREYMVKRMTNSLLWLKTESKK